MKLYGEDEIGAILKRAAENSSKDSSDTSVGLSIEELQQLASDAGIDPDQIAKAIAEIDVEAGIPERTLLGGPFSFDSHALMEGEISATEWEEMLMSIRKTFKSEGVVSSRESVMEWSSPWGTSNSAHVTAVKGDGKTKVRVFWNGPMTALPYYIPVPLVAIASLPFASEFLQLSAVPGMSFVLLASGLTFLTGRWALKKRLNNLFTSFRQMMKGFEETEIPSSQVDEVKSQIEAREPLLNLDEADRNDELRTRPRERDRS